MSDRIVNRYLNPRIRQVLYALKRQYGGSIDIYQKGSQSVDYEDGTKTIDKDVIFVQRAIILPAKVLREANQSISVISANKAFIYGGTYDSSTRMFIVDRRDVPDLPELTEDDWIVYDGRKFEIKQFEMAEFDSAFVITGKAVLGDVPEQIHLLAADSLLRLGQTDTTVLSRLYRLQVNNQLQLEQTNDVEFAIGITADNLLALGQSSEVVRSRLLTTNNSLALGQVSGAELVYIRAASSSISLGQASTGSILDPASFVTSWKTDNAGDSGNNQIKLFLESSGTYNFEVKWGDGTSDTITVWNQAETTHTYASAGTYTVVITGTCYGWRQHGDRLKILDVIQWGTVRLGNSSGYFYQCANLTGSATDTLDMTGTTNMQSTFNQASLFNGVCDSWSMSAVTTMASMFPSTLFNQDIGSWNVSSVTNMAVMFSGTPFNQDIGSWDVSAVTDMQQMFKDTPFNQDIDSWVVSAVTNMNQMFRNSSFNQDIGSWNVSSVVLMMGMFYNTSFNQDIGSWNTGAVHDMDWMFRSTPFDQDISSWDITTAVHMALMFEGGGLSTSNYDALLVGWEAQAVQSNVNFHAGSSTYSSGAPATARAALIADHYWTITDGGPA